LLLYIPTFRKYRPKQRHAQIVLSMVNSSVVNTSVINTLTYLPMKMYAQNAIRRILTTMLELRETLSTCSTAKARVCNQKIASERNTERERERERQRERQ